MQLCCQGSPRVHNPQCPLVDCSKTCMAVHLTHSVYGFVQHTTMQSGEFCMQPHLDLVQRHSFQCLGDVTAGSSNTSNLASGVSIHTGTDCCCDCCPCTSHHQAHTKTAAGCSQLSQRNAMSMLRLCCCCYNQHRAELLDKGTLPAALTAPTSSSRLQQPGTSQSPGPARA